MDVRLLCDIASVSSSGYYRWLKTADQPDRDDEDYSLIKNLFDKGKGRIGHRQIVMQLDREKHIIMNHKKVNRIMNKYRLITKVRRRNPYKQIMKKTQEHRTCPNHLSRQFQQYLPFKFLCTDITYIRLCGRFAYLSVVKDIASREIVAWSLSWHINMDLVFATVRDLQHNAASGSWLLNEAMLHSDQGFHYTNPDYISLVKKLDIKQSMSRKGNCIDNAPMESFFGHLKDEVEYKNCKNLAELKYLIKEYIDYYNGSRPQWELKKMTPVEYRNHLMSFH